MGPFMDEKAQPSTGDLARVLGPAAKAWDALRAHVHAE